MNSTALENRPKGQLTDSLRSRLIQALGQDHVLETDAARIIASEDIWDQAKVVVDAVVTPTDSDALARAVSIIAQAGCPIAIRGGGMSYTLGYVPTKPGTITLDLSLMDQVLAVDAESMTVTVGAGCTWQTLYEHLKPLGLRTPFWGPLSGISSTIGGGISQLNALFGAGTYGTSSESVVGLKIILADGQILTTGAKRSTTNHPFYRHYGPDLTGLFCGDCGALGIKAEITLRLIQAPSVEAYGSFSFPSHADAISCLRDIARAGLACDLFGFDPALARARLKRASLAADISALGNVISHQSSLLKGITEAAKIAFAGRSFIDKGDYSVHVVCEGRNDAGVQADMDQIKRIAVSYGGRAIENTIPKVMRSMPFTPLNNILGPGGERWVPIHGIVAMADANAVIDAIQSAFAKRALEFDAHGIETGFMFTTMSTNGFLIEPVFFWPAARTDIHDKTVDAKILAHLPRFADNPAATKLVADARAEVIKIFQSFGAAHYQIGRTYPYFESLDPAAQTLLGAIKSTLDSQSKLSPGNLGLA